MAPFHWAMSQPGGRLMTLDHFFHESLFLTGKTLTLDINLSSLCAILFPKLPSVDFTECLTHHHGIPHSTISEQGTHLTAKEV